jgi:hypothetical protein
MRRPVGALAAQAGDALGKSDRAGQRGLGPSCAAVDAGSTIQVNDPGQLGDAVGDTRRGA